MAEATDGPQRDTARDLTEDQQGGPDYEGLLLRAGYNYHVFVAAAFANLRERGADAERLVGWVAERLAPTWAGLRGHGADAVLNLILENLAATGYPVHHIEYGADESWAEVGAIPLGLSPDQWQRLLEPLDVTPAEMHQLFRVFVPLAQSAGATLDLAGFRDSLRITVRRLDLPDQAGHQPAGYAPPEPR